MKVQSGYIPTLDGWRAVAVFGVLSYHAVGNCSTGPGTSKIVAFITELGPRGVDIFFGLSGLLISLRLLEEAQKRGSISLKRFYIRRAFRIFPPALVFLIIIGALGYAHKLPISRGEWLSSLLFVRNYYPNPSALSVYTVHFWTLAIEEHFYLFWPVLLIILGQRRARWAVPGLIVAIAVWRNIEFHHDYLANIFPDVALGFRTDIRVDSLLGGCLVALLLQVPGIRAALTRMLWWPVSTALGIWYLAVVFGLWKPHVVVLLEALAVPLLIAATALHPQEYLGRFLEFAPLRWIGRLSYSLYVWQQLFMIGHCSISLGWLQKFPFSVVAMFAAAITSYYFIEKPMIRLGHRLATPATEGRGDLAPSEESLALAVSGS